MPKRKSRAEQKALRPHEILDAAFEEFSEKGYNATRLEDIGRRIGITKGTIYLYFPTKEALFEAVAQHTSRPFAEVLSSLGKLEGNYTEKLKTLLLMAYKNISEDKRIQKMLRLSLTEGMRFPEMADRHYEEFIAPLSRAVGTLVSDGVTTGEFRQGAAAGMPDVVMSSVLHITVWRLLATSRLPIDEQAFIDAHIDLTMNGLLTRN
ncbi:TPA: TetR/AcrR family transcriptional regulator [Klebsiella michiganensis]|uniref:TetR/AcrR family transcriptional regulator n=1 Tax=Enterobacter hormaechei TaxID=158836 RepID=UPI003908210E|nr:TetR/AcrR family transcriptional regulator [Enterobacter hormaechei subsp. steigerwaltii]HAV1583972.1 TetR/AcrR family transcriptional regulator [Enterobacter hormaechei subsp. steigerwaltii]